MQLVKLRISFHDGLVNITWLEDQPGSDDVERVSILAFAAKDAYLQSCLDLLTLLYVRL